MQKGGTRRTAEHLESLDLHLNILEHYKIAPWLVVSTPLKNMKVNLDDYSQYIEKYKMFQTTNQRFIYSSRGIPVNFECVASPV